MVTVQNVSDADNLNSYKYMIIDEPATHRYYVMRF